MTQTISITLRLSQAVRDAQAVETGQIPPAVVSRTLDLRALTTDQRREVIGIIGATETADLSTLHPEHPTRATRYEVDQLPHTPEDWMRVVTDYGAARAASEARRRARSERRISQARRQIAFWENFSDAGLELEARTIQRYAEPEDLPEEDLQRLHALRERSGELLLQRREREQRAAQEEARRVAEQRAWVATHGSAGLRSLVAAGDRVWAWDRYVTERAALEHPGYEVQDSLLHLYTWVACKRPSPGAQAQAQRDGATVAHLVDALDDFDFDELSEEVLVIPDYHGRFLTRQL